MLMPSSFPLLPTRRDALTLAPGKSIDVIVAAIGDGAQDIGCQQGPGVLQAPMVAMLGQDDQVKPSINAPLWPASSLPSGQENSEIKMARVQSFIPILANAVLDSMQSGNRPLILGGDHSCAVGTWSGVAQAQRLNGPIGLVWIDAHLDSHTPATSPSQAPHGMPLAALLGHGPEGLTHVLGWSGKLLPQHVVVIGARSHESGEYDLLHRLGVRIMPNTDVFERGFKACLTEALALVREGTCGFGVSFDLDVLDPSVAPGVGSPEPHGLELADTLEGLSVLTHSSVMNDLLAFELVEYNPGRDDVNQRSLKACLALVKSALVAP